MWNTPDISNLDEIGSATLGRAVTHTLYVSPNGTNAGGKTWITAFTTIQAALTAASTDGDDCTLIMISPHTTFYNINTTGDPTFSCNCILHGTHRTWAQVKNTHDSATSILKLTGKASIINLNFHLGTGSGNGVIMTHGGFRVRRCQFIGEYLTGAATALSIEGASTINRGMIEDTHFIDNITHMTAIRLDTIAASYVNGCNIHACLKGVQVVHSDSVSNHFNNLDVGGCAIGFDIDAGADQHIADILFHENTVNIDDEVGEHHYANIRGDFPITYTPDDVIGVTVATHANANTWGSDVVIRAAAAKPFRIVGASFQPSVDEAFRVRLFDGTTYFDDNLFFSGRKAGTSAPSGTEFIFNTGTVISASAQSASGGDNVLIWVEVQEI